MRGAGPVARRWALAERGPLGQSRQGRAPRRQPPRASLPPSLSLCSGPSRAGTCATSEWSTERRLCSACGRPATRGEAAPPGPLRPTCCAQPFAPRTQRRGERHPDGRPHRRAPGRSRLHCLPAAVPHFSCTFIHCPHPLPQRRRARHPHRRPHRRALVCSRLPCFLAVGSSPPHLLPPPCLSSLPPARSDEGKDILIVARTDARQAADSLDEALWRAAAFADAGADVVFIDALESEAEMGALCRVPGAYKARQPWGVGGGSGVGQ